MASATAALVGLVNIADFRSILVGASRRGGHRLTTPRYWCCLDLKQRTGSDVFASLVQTVWGQPAIATLLESPSSVCPANSSASQPSFPLAWPASPPSEKASSDPSANAQYSICAGPPNAVPTGQQQLWTPPLGQILPLLRQRLRDLSPDQGVSPASEIRPNPALPFWGGWLGWLGYDTAWEIEKLPYKNPDPLPFPVAFWYEPASFAVLDHAQQQLWLAAPNPDTLALMRQSQCQPGPPKDIKNTPSPERWARPQTQQLTFGMRQAEFEQAVKAAKQHIQAGDVFQVNLSLRFQAETTLSPWQVYRALQQINPSPFASYWQTPWGSVISSSPERLVKLRGTTAQTRPIAGTRPRGLTPEQDRHLAQELLSNRKENAEHIMLVDLERNDLGRVSEWGSVHVDELLVIERYSHVMHLVSNVVGQLHPACNAIDLIAAMFPGGTISGCPKVRCMEIIESLEPLRRSLFYGSCGYLDSRGYLDLNILIRTLLMGGWRGHQQTVWGQVGAGIVADSDPEREWHESLQKAKAQLLALGL
ncbi:MAG: anthranilate synthase component I [Cyanobacteria bacterium P01_A01_bin.114]